MDTASVTIKTAWKDTENEHDACDKCGDNTDAADGDCTKFRSRCEGQSDLHPVVNTAESERHRCADSMHNIYGGHLAPLYVPIVK